MSLATGTPDTFSLTYDDTTRQLLGYWPGPTSPEAMYTHYAELLAAAQAHGNCRYWLLDMRTRSWHSPEFGTWFGTAFPKLVHAALRQPVFVAYVLTPQHRAIADSAGTEATLRSCAAHGVYPFFFDNVPDALAWLTHQQAHA